MTIGVYDFTRGELTELLAQRTYPEQSREESAIIHDWLVERGQDFDRWSFSVRVGDGMAPDPAHLPGVQFSTRFSTQKRIDVIAWYGPQAWLIEVKERITPGVLGQLQTYKHLWQEANPDALEPRLMAIGRRSDSDTLGALQAHSVDVYLYESSEVA